MKKLRNERLDIIFAAKATKTPRVSERIEQVLTHPNPYRFTPDQLDLTLGEQKALILAFDGYGLRDMLHGRYGKEQERRLWERSFDKNFVFDPLEVIQEIP